MLRSYANCLGSMPHLEVAQDPDIRARIAAARVRRRIAGARRTRRPTVVTDVSPDLAQDITAVRAPQLPPDIDFGAPEKLGLRRPVPPSLIAPGRVATPTLTRPTGRPRPEIGGRAPTLRVPLEEFAAKPPIRQDITRLTAGVARAPFVGVLPRALGVDPEEQALIDPGARGAIVRGVGTLGAVAAEILLTKGAAGVVAPRVAPGVVRSGLELIAETRGGTAGRRAARGALEGIPTDVGFGVLDPDLSIAESIALGSGVGAAGEVLLPLVARALRGAQPVDVAARRARIRGEIAEPDIGSRIAAARERRTAPAAADRGAIRMTGEKFTTDDLIGEVTDVHEILPVLRGDAAGVADNFGLDTATEAFVREAREALVRDAQESLVRRGLPDVIPVFRGGAFREGEGFVSVTTRESTARFFAKQRGEEVQPLFIRRGDVVADGESLVRAISAEEELVVPRGMTFETEAAARASTSPTAAGAGVRALGPAPATDLARATATPVQSEIPVRPEAPPEGSLPDPQQGGFFDLGVVGVVRKFFRREFTSAGDLPEAVFRRKVLRDGWMSSQQTSIRNTLADFRRTARRAFGTRPNEDQLRAIDDVLKGEATPETIPETLRPVVQTMRDELDAMSRRMIDTGLVEGDLVAKVTSNLGSYTTRSYRVFDDPDWALKVPQDVRNKAKALLRSEFPGKTEDEIDGLIASLLYRIEDGPVALLSRGTLGSKDLSILKRRKDIAPEIRALWGEFRDPRVNYARSVTKMANAIANHEFLGEVRTAGLGTFFHERPVVIDGIEYKAQIAAEGSTVMAPLNGLYTTTEINQAFKDALDPVAAAPWFRAYMKINGVVKYNKTVGSVMTHVRNVSGNTGFAVANGHVRVGEAGKALRAIATNIGRLDSAEWRTYYRHLQELGVVDQSALAGELRAAIRDAMGQDGVELLSDPNTSVVRRGLGFVTDLYRAEDDVWKVYAFENEKFRYARNLPDLSEPEIEQIAARIVRDTYPTYSQIPRAIRAVRMVPIMGTFVSFPAEVFRVGWNTLNLALTELADPALRSIGAQRLVGLMVASTGTAAAAAAARNLTGVTRDMDEDLRRFLPPWSENSQIIHLGRDDDGNMKFVDISYTDPYSYLKKPVIAAMRGDDWQSSLFAAASEAFDPFLSEEILSERLVDIARNTTQTGGRVFNPADHPIRRFQSIANHVYEALEPGTISSARRIVMGITGTTTVYGRAYDPQMEALAVMTGMRLSILDVRQAFSFRARDHSREIRNSQRILSSVVTRRGEVGQSEITRAFGGMQMARNAAFDAAHEDAMAALRLGMTRTQIVQSLRSIGMSRANAVAIYTGNITQYRPTESLFGGLENVIRAEGGDVGEAARRFNERRRAIAELIGATP